VPAWEGFIQKPLKSKTTRNIPLGHVNAQFSVIDVQRQKIFVYFEDQLTDRTIIEVETLRFEIKKKMNI
jgi:hypothetical protein